MDERDILVSDIRVTVLGKSGQYVFDWVDQDQDKVRFVSNESDYEEYTDEVKELLNGKGIFTVDQDNEDSGGEESEDVGFETTVDEETDDGNEDSGFSPVEDLGTPDDDNEESTQSTDNEEFECSFIVRMDNPNQRREAINNIKDSNPEAADKMELTGPFEVTYRVGSDGKVELKSVEDLGIGSKTD